MSGWAGIVLKYTSGSSWLKVLALQKCGWPLTWESSVSFGSLWASVTHSPGGACVSHESLLTSGPFKTSRTLRTHMPGWGLSSSLIRAASFPENRTLPCGHSYLFLPADRTRQAGPGARDPHPILWSLGFLELLGSPHLLCFQGEQQTQVALGALDNLSTSVTRKESINKRKAQPWPRAAGLAAGGAQEARQEVIHLGDGLWQVCHTG